MFRKLSKWIRGLQDSNQLNKVSSTLQDIVDGNILLRDFFRRQYFLIFLMVIFCIMYIGNRYACDQSMRKERELEKQLIDKRYELLSISSELTKKSRCSVIEDSIDAQIPDLKLSKTPPISIEKQ